MLIFCTQFNSARIVDAYYAWLMYGWYSEDWWRSLDNISCSEDKLAAVLERALVVEQYPIAAKEIHNSSFSPFVETLAYDSVFTLALALNRTVHMINTNDTLDCGPSPVPLEEFSYDNSSTACLIRHSLSNTNFTGLSVSIGVMTCIHNYSKVLNRVELILKIMEFVSK